MIRGMTAFGFHQEIVNNLLISFSLTSVNRRHLEITTRLPQLFVHLDSRIKKRIQEKVHRGHLHVQMSCEDISKKHDGISYEREIDWPKVEDFSRFCHEIAAHLAATVTTKDIWSLIVSDTQRYYKTQEKESHVTHDTSHDDAVLEILSKALDGLILEKDIEGKAIAREFLGRIDFLRTNHALIMKKIGSRDQIIHSIQKRLIDLLSPYTSQEILSDDKMMREIVLHADKSDVSEELHRIDHHLSSLSLLLEENQYKDCIGKQAEFTLQELLREYNTLGAKSLDVQVITSVVEAKTEIEKLREQVQNVE